MGSSACQENVRSPRSLSLRLNVIDGGVPEEGYVLCNGRACHVADDNYCCYPSGGSSPQCRSTVYTCGGTARFCDGQEDCGTGEVCCQHYPGSYTRVECLTTCSGTIIP